MSRTNNDQSREDPLNFSQLYEGLCSSIHHAEGTGTSCPAFGQMPLAESGADSPPNSPTVAPQPSSRVRTLLRLGMPRGAWRPTFSTRRFSAPAGPHTPCRTLTVVAPLTLSAAGGPARRCGTARPGRPSALALSTWPTTSMRWGARLMGGPRGGHDSRLGAQGSASGGGAFGDGGGGSSTPP